eukprot:Rhum_TRINITY_DN4349_c0_g1::Rhum_TRINITY_DN4349_c0_g1_i1::g.13866::m.13866
MTDTDDRCKQDRCGKTLWDCEGKLENAAIPRRVTTEAHSQLPLPPLVHVSVLVRRLRGAVVVRRLLVAGLRGEHPVVGQQRRDQILLLLVDAVLFAAVLQLVLAQGVRAVGAVAAAARLGDVVHGAAHTDLSARIDPDLLFALVVHGVAHTLQSVAGAAAGAELPGGVLDHRVASVAAQNPLLQMPHTVSLNTHHEDAQMQKNVLQSKVGAHAAGSPGLILVVKPRVHVRVVLLDVVLRDPAAVGLLRLSLTRLGGHLLLGSVLALHDVVVLLCLLCLLLLLAFLPAARRALVPRAPPRQRRHARGVLCLLRVLRTALLLLPDVVHNGLLLQRHGAARRRRRRLPRRCGGVEAVVLLRHRVREADDAQVDGRQGAEVTRHLRHAHHLAHALLRRLTDLDLKGERLDELLRLQVARLRQHVLDRHEHVRLLRQARGTLDQTTRVEHERLPEGVVLSVGGGLHLLLRRRGLGRRLGLRRNLVLRIDRRQHALRLAFGGHVGPVLPGKLCPRHRCLSGERAWVCVSQ